MMHGGKQDRHLLLKTIQMSVILSYLPILPIYAYMEHQGVVSDLNLRRNEGVNQLHLHKEGSIA